MKEKSQLTKREKIITIISGLIIVVLIGVVLFQYFTIIKVQKELVNNTDNNMTASEDSKIVWINPEVTVSAPDVSEENGSLLEISDSTEPREYVINKNSKKIHSPDCKSAQETLDKNKETVLWTEEDYFKSLENGYSPCSICKAGR